MSIEEIYAMFPNLQERRMSQGTRLSCGEQQVGAYSAHGRQPAAARRDIRRARACHRAGACAHDRQRSRRAATRL
ncbi:MAG: Broad-specificity amino acid ABC transporter, ATP-binding protein 2 [uncultured Paraburkholderia sp.]|nr:MAG: Broad-specificity amino acid ABC transporter, ATP-binding protein 2 [uncultured Paraburkholderia sp.]